MERAARRGMTVGLQLQEHPPNNEPLQEYKTEPSPEADTNPAPTHGPLH